MSNTITIKREISENFLSDILITAFDGSYGWSWHWFEPAPTAESESWLRTCTCPDRHWLAVKARLKEDCLTGHDVLDSRDGYWIDHAAILTGIQRILDDDYLHATRPANEREMEQIRESEAWQQGALVGTLPYGGQRRWTRGSRERSAHLVVETGETARGLRSDLARIMGETEPDAGDIDAPFADAIVQVGALGKCVFS